MTASEPGGLPAQTLREEICAWLAANGANADDVLAGRRVTVTDDRIHFVVVARHGDGVLRRDRANALVARAASVPLTVPAPPCLGPWLAGRVTQSMLSHPPSWFLPTASNDRARP